MSNAVKQGEFLAMIVRERLHKLIIKELKARIKVLEKALGALGKDYERMKAAAQVAYQAMVAMELSDSSKREWDAAVRLLREALKEVREK